MEQCGALAEEVLKHMLSSESFGRFAEELRKSECTGPDAGVLREIGTAAKEVWGPSAELVLEAEGLLQGQGCDFSYRAQGLLYAASLEEMQQLKERCVLIPGVEAHGDITSALQLRLPSCTIEISPDEAAYFKPVASLRSGDFSAALSPAARNATWVLKHLFRNIVPEISSWWLDDLVQAACRGDSAVTLDATGCTLFVRVLRVMGALLPTRQLSCGHFVFPVAMAQVVESLLAEYDNLSASQVLKHVRSTQERRLAGRRRLDAPGSASTLDKGLSAANCDESGKPSTKDDVPEGRGAPALPQKQAPPEAFGATLAAGLISDLGLARPAPEAPPARKIPPANRKTCESKAPWAATAELGPAAVLELRGGGQQREEEDGDVSAEHCEETDDSLRPPGQAGAPATCPEAVLPSVRSRAAPSGSTAAGAAAAPSGSALATQVQEELILSTVLFYSRVPTIKQRVYSICSSSDYRPGKCQLLVVREDWQAKGGDTKFGLCSSFLTFVRSGQWCVAHSTHSVMHMPEDKSVPVFMAGLGTGLAPFRAFVEQRRHEKSKGINVGPMTLFFGGRYSKAEYYYRDEFELFEKEGLVKCCNAWSRDTSKKVYVQHKIMEEADAIWRDLGMEGSKGAFFLCGSKQPEKDVFAAILTIFQSKGGMTEAQSKAKMDQLQSVGRYVTEVY